jgi:Ran GTPase-activating protein (RanGAP) involved in mRNA processing and transport
VCVKAAAGGQVSAADLEILVSCAPKCPDLQLLELSGLAWDNRQLMPSITASVAAAACHWPQLQHLDLRDNVIDADAARSLVAAAPHLAHLQHLNLSSNYLRPEGLQVLITAAQHWRELEHLDLSANDLRDEGAELLAEAAEAWPQLRRLRLSNNCIGMVRLAGTLALVRAAQAWPQLQELDVCGVIISQSVERALLAVRHRQGQISGSPCLLVTLSDRDGGLVTRTIKL